MPGGSGRWRSRSLPGTACTKRPGKSRGSQATRPRVYVRQPHAPAVPLAATDRRHLLLRGISDEADRRGRLVLKSARAEPEDHEGPTHPGAVSHRCADLKPPDRGRILRFHCSRRGPQHDPRQLHPDPRDPRVERGAPMSTEQHASEHTAEQATDSPAPERDPARRVRSAAGATWALTWRSLAAVTAGLTLAVVLAVVALVGSAQLPASAAAPARPPRSGWRSPRWSAWSWRPCSACSPASAVSRPRSSSATSWTAGPVRPVSRGVASCAWPAACAPRCGRPPRRCWRLPAWPPRSSPARCSGSSRCWPPSPCSAGRPAIPRSVPSLAATCGGQCRSLRPLPCWPPGPRCLPPSSTARPYARQRLPQPASRGSPR